MRSIFVSVRQGKLAKWQNDFLNEAMRWIFAVMIVLRLTNSNFSKSKLTSPMTL